MASLKTEYGTDAQAITCTLASLASAAAREATVIDNTTNKWLDAYVQVAVKTGAGAPAGQKAVNVYCYGTVDTATPTYPDAVTGADAGITLVSPTELTLLGVIYTPSASTTYKGQVWSVAKALGIYLPEKWGIVIENQVGQTLDATEGNHKKIYQGLYATVV